jgi:hypothetical protein
MCTLQLSRWIFENQPLCIIRYYWTIMGKLGIEGILYKEIDNRWVWFLEMFYIESALYDIGSNFEKQESIQLHSIELNL